MTNLYKNEEVRSITIKYFIVLLIALISGFFILNININNLNKAYINQNKVLASRLIALNPDIKGQIMKTYMQNIEEKDIKDSEKALNEYGYKDTLEVYKNPVISEFNNKITIEYMISLLCIAAIFYFTSIREFSKVFVRIREFSEAAEKVVEGNFDKIFPGNKEGEFYILGSQFNIMAKRLEESLNKLKDDKIYLKNVISDIFHQLKTPLAAVILYVGLMQNEKDMDIEERNELLKSSAEQLDRMDWLCKNLLKLARLEAGTIKFAKENNLLYQTIEKALAPVYIKSQEKHQKIAVEVDRKIEFKHDPRWLSEAITNIIKNAIEHTPCEGRIKITSEETPLSVQIFIEDNGEGIPKSEINKIFNRFYKGENSTNPASIGIGLALSKTIIDGQDGSIRVRSEEGKGTEFNITFLKTVI